LAVLLTLSGLLANHCIALAGTGSVCDSLDLAKVLREVDYNELYSMPIPRRQVDLEWYRQVSLSIFRLYPPIGISTIISTGSYCDKRIQFSEQMGEILLHEVLPEHPNFDVNIEFSSDTGEINRICLGWEDVMVDRESVANSWPYGVPWPSIVYKVQTVPDFPLAKGLNGVTTRHVLVTRMYASPCFTANGKQYGFKQLFQPEK
jgi:hypothetical protein